jgi:hypothetical protein
MKTTKLALATLAALGGFALAANTAAARPDIHVSLRFGAPAPVVRYAPPAPVAYYPAPAPMVIIDRHHRAVGYWKEVVVKTWVPARIVNSYDRRGRVVRVIEPGHFIYRTDRVWENHCG